MTIELDLQSIINKPEFTSLIAEAIAYKYHNELFTDWREQFMREFVKQLEEMTKNAVEEYVKDERNSIRNAISIQLSKLTKEELIDLIKSGHLPF